MGQASLNLICVDPAEVDQVWPSIKNGVAFALKRGLGGSVSEIEQGVLSGLSLVWLAVEGTEARGVCITDLIKTDDGLKCVIRVLAGHKMADWFEHLSGIEEFARKEGCYAIEVRGRHGWKRVLKDYAEIGVVLQKRLEQENGRIDYRAEN